MAKNQNFVPTLKILEAGLDAANPQIFMKKFVKKNKIITKKQFKLSKYSDVYVVAFGKAADSMAKAVSSRTRIKSGIIVIPKGSTSIIKNRRFKIIHAGHPLPNEESISATKKIISFLKQRKQNDFIIFLVSGGSSALLAMPDGISLPQKSKTTELLLKSGCTIQELNCVRKHLSQIKGGKLIQNMPCSGVALVMSDVVGNDLSSIASGTTYCDPTTFAEALKIIKKYKLQSKVPKNVLARLREGKAGKICETPKKPKIANHIIATNGDCLDAMTKKAKQLHLKTKTVIISGNIKKISQKLVPKIPKKGCLLFGGEPTVKVQGKGKGGRSQELVLRILNKVSSSNNSVVIASMGTDGIDGNTTYAGAIAQNNYVKKNNIKSYLQKNDSNSFFKKNGGLIKTGPTHTNLLDIGIIYT